MDKNVRNADFKSDIAQSIEKSYQLEIQRFRVTKIITSTRRSSNYRHLQDDRTITDIYNEQFNDHRKLNFASN